LGDSIVPDRGPIPSRARIHDDLREPVDVKEEKVVTASSRQNKELRNVRVRSRHLRRFKRNLHVFAKLRVK